MEDDKLLARLESLAGEFKQYETRLERIEEFFGLEKNDSTTQVMMGLIDGRLPLISEDELIKEAEKECISPAKAKASLETLRKRGEIFYPKPGFVRMIWGVTLWLNGQNGN